MVFDEASQVPPQDAINCIYRGEQLIVAGDSKQLPPTPFFQIAELDELAPDDEDASTEEDMESVLDACEALLPSHAAALALPQPRRAADRLLQPPDLRRLAGHLSVGERALAADGRRLRARRPTGSTTAGERATNRREAQVVAERVMHYLLDGTGRSLGVIAFNTAQANAIAEELDLLRSAIPSSSGTSAATAWTPSSSSTSKPSRATSAT